MKKCRALFIILESIDWRQYFDYFSIPCNNENVCALFEEQKGTGDGKNDESADNSSQSKLVSSISVSSCDIGKISLGFLVYWPSGCFGTQYKGVFDSKLGKVL